MMDPSTTPTGASPSHYHLLVKPSGAACNLSCKYCFFLSKEALYPGERHRMDEITLEAYLSQLMASSAGSQVQIAWQGGEPLLRGLEFYKRSVQIAERYRKAQQHVRHSIQTNGTRSMTTGRHSSETMAIWSDSALTAPGSCTTRSG